MYILRKSPHIIILLSLFLATPSVYGQQTMDPGFESYLTAPLNDGIDLITGKSVYIAGERIWFSAWVYDLVSGIVADTGSTVYVGLFDDKGENLFSGKYPLENGRTYGDIQLPFSLPTAWYRLAVQTGDPGASKVRCRIREFPVINIYKPASLPATFIPRKPVLSFIPRNGNYIAGDSCRALVRITGLYGYPFTGKAKLVLQTDSTETLIDTFSTGPEGFATINFLPGCGKPYGIRMDDPDTLLPLPSPPANGIICDIEKEFNGTSRLQADLTALQDHHLPVKMIVTTAGKILGSVPFNERQKKSFVLPAETMINQSIAVYFLDKHGTYIDHRRIWLDAKSSEKTEIMVGDTVFQTRSNISFSAGIFLPEERDKNSCFTAGITDSASLVFSGYDYLYDRCGDTERIIGIPSSHLYTGCREMNEYTGYLADQDLVREAGTGCRKIFSRDELAVFVTTDEPDQENRLMVSIPGNVPWIRSWWFPDSLRTKITLPPRTGEYPMVFQVFRDRQTLPFTLNTGGNGETALSLPARIRPTGDYLKLINLTETQQKKAEVRSAYEMMGIDLIRTPEVAYRNENPDRKAFYGKPGQVFRISDFPQDGDLRNFIRMYVPQIKIKEKKGVASLKFNPLYLDELSRRQKPFMLLNGVPFTDMNKILALPQSRTDRIELVMRPFIYDEYLFEGIISVFTKEPGNVRDLLPAGSKTVMVDGFTPRTENLPADQTVDYTKEQKRPDIRTLLYWNPAVGDEQDWPELSFTTPDQTGVYYIFVEGEDGKGKRVSARRKIRVRKEF